MRSLSNRFIDDVQRAIDRMSPNQIPSDRAKMLFPMPQALTVRTGEVHEPFFVLFTTRTRKSGNCDCDTRSRSPQSAAGHCLGDFSAHCTEVCQQCSVDVQKVALGLVGRCDEAAFENMALAPQVS